MRRFTDLKLLTATTLLVFFVWFGGGWLLARQLADDPEDRGAPPPLTLVRVAWPADRAPLSMLGAGFGARP